MPEARPSGLTKKLLPPPAMRIGTLPTLQRVEVSPILPHPDMRRQHRPKQRFMGNNPSGWASTDWAIFGPKPNNVFSPVQWLTLMPR